MSAALWTCSICGNLLDRDLCFTRCGHLFHIACLKDWWHAQGNTIFLSPCCRTNEMGEGAGGGRPSPALITAFTPHPIDTLTDFAGEKLKPILEKRRAAADAKSKAGSAASTAAAAITIDDSSEQRILGLSPLELALLASHSHSSKLRTATTAFDAAVSRNNEWTRKIRDQQKLAASHVERRKELRERIAALRSEIETRETTRRTAEQELTTKHAEHERWRAQTNVLERLAKVKAEFDRVLSLGESKLATSNSSGGGFALESVSELKNLPALVSDPVLLTHETHTRVRTLKAVQNLMSTLTTHAQASHDRAMTTLEHQRITARDLAAQRDDSISFAARYRAESAIIRKRITYLQTLEQRLSQERAAASAAAAAAATAAVAARSNSLLSPGTASVGSTTPSVHRRHNSATPSPLSSSSPLSALRKRRAETPLAVSAGHSGAQSSPSARRRLQSPHANTTGSASALSSSTSTLGPHQMPRKDLQRRRLSMTSAAPSASKPPSQPPQHRIVSSADEADDAATVALLAAVQNDDPADIGDASAAGSSVTTQSAGDRDDVQFEAPPPPAPASGSAWSVTATASGTSGGAHTTTTTTTDGDDLAALMSLAQPDEPAGEVSPELIPRRI